MTRYVALLRGINVGGHKMVAMADLRALLTRLGFADVKAVLQSGNIVFGSTARSAARLESQLESEVAKTLTVTTEFHVRNAAEWQAVVDANPFCAEAERAPSHLLVTFFKEPLAAAAVAALQAAITGPERLQAEGRHLYMTFPDGVGTSKAAVLAGRMLPRGTARNWNTVMKLSALTGG